MGWDLAVDLYLREEFVLAEMSLPGIDPITSRRLSAGFLSGK